MSAAFLKSIRCDSLLFPWIIGDEANSEQSHVKMLKGSESLTTAITTLVENNISAIPVLGPATGSGQGTGSWFSMLDVVSVFTTLANRDEPIPQEVLHHVPIDKLARQTSAYRFYSLPESASAYDAAKLMVEKDVSRVAVHVEGRPLVLRSIITDSRLNKLLLAAEGPTLKSVFNKSLRELGLTGNKEPIWVSKEAPVIQAFEKMQKHGVRSIAVVNEDFAKDPKLVAHISASDLVRLIAADVREKVPPLALLPAELKLSVKEFLRWRDAVSPVQAHPESLQFAYPSSNLGQVMRLMSFHDIHKIFIVSEDGHFHIRGVVTLNDILKVFLDAK